MGNPFPFSLLTLSLLLLLLLSQSSALKPPRNLRPQFISDLHSSPKHLPPTRYFEVTKPVEPSPAKRKCSFLALSHTFGSTYGKPPVTAEYGLPASCDGPAPEFSKIVMEWTAESKGRQFDRIFGVWLEGVELLRSCTAEPRATGTIWTVEKDVTRYHSLLIQKKKQTLAVYLGNIVDDTYTGLYHVNVSFHYYPSVQGRSNKARDLRADLVIPVSRNDPAPASDGLWFTINGANNQSSSAVTIPRNAYRAILEVYVSFHENDEFWYGNFPDEYIQANNLTAPGKGPFREVIATVDGVTVGAIWPFTVIFTGGINPLLWRPISAIGSFNLPSYDIEITPSLGRILDGKSHRIGFHVNNGLNVWYVNANLHLWLDKNSRRTFGSVSDHWTPPPTVSLTSNFTGFDGTFVTRVSREISSAGWVKSSKGNITTTFDQSLFFTNEMVLGNDANKQVVDQTIYNNNTVVFGGAPARGSSKNFTLHMYSDAAEAGNETAYLSDLALGLHERLSRGSRMVEEVRNEQSGEGKMIVKGNLVQSGIGSLRQVYDFVGGPECYSRNISSSNYTILYDHVSTRCDRHHHRKGGFVGVHRNGHLAL